MNNQMIRTLVLFAALLSSQLCFSSCKENPLLPTTYWITSGTYVSAFGGYASEDWVTFAATPFISYSSNSRGGMNYGFTLGYRFYRFFAIEGGWVRLPTVKGVALTNATLSPPLFSSSGISQWFGYLSGKFYVTLPNHFYLFGGAGIMYRATNPRPTQFFTNNQAYYYAPIALAGLEWYFTQDWAVYTQYYFVPEYNLTLLPQPVNFLNVPAANLIELGLLYKFSI